MSGNEELFPEAGFEIEDDASGSTERDLVIVLIDASGSMLEPGYAQGATRADETRRWVEGFFAGLPRISNGGFMRRGEVAIATFFGDKKGAHLQWHDLGGERTWGEFFLARTVDTSRFVGKLAPKDRTDWTPMGEAVLGALEVVEARKADLKDRRIQYTRPSIFVVTDGVPSHMATVDRASEALRTVELEGKAQFWAACTHEADEELMARTLAVPERTFKLRGKSIMDVVEFLLNSVEAGLENPGADAHARRSSAQTDLDASMAP